MSDDSNKDRRDMVTRGDLLQANATLITGMLIFVGIFTSFRSDISGMDFYTYLGLVMAYSFFIISLTSFIISLHATINDEGLIKIGKREFTLYQIAKIFFL